MTGGMLEGGAEPGRPCRLHPLAEELARGSLRGRFFRLRARLVESRAGRLAVEALLYLVAWLWRRLLFRTRFVAITGSLGKTTAKECLAAVLSAEAPTASTSWNENTRFGIARSVLRVRFRHRWAVLEVGVVSRGEMRRYARLVRPHVGVVLNVARTHTRKYRDLDEQAGVLAELLRRLPRGGAAALNGDDPRTAAMTAQGRQVVRFGSDPGFEVWADEVSSCWPRRLSFRAHRGARTVRVRTWLVGAHWLPAVLSALAVASAEGLDLDTIARRIARVEPFPGRLSPVRLPGGAVVLRDDYNSSIDSMLPGLAVLREAAARRRLLVFTDLTDLEGNRRARLRRVVPHVARAADVAIVIGESAEWGCRRLVEAGMAPGGAHPLAGLEEAARFLREELRDGDLVLLRGRTTDHVARLFFAQLGSIACWKPSCAKTILCDSCWELGARPDEVARARIVPPPQAVGA